MTVQKRRMAMARVWLGALTFATLAVTSAVPVHALEVIPSLGITKSTSANAGDGQVFGGLAVRAPLLPFLKAEGGISYRQDDIVGSDTKVRQWPVTASLWVAPIPMVYAGGGLGWYRTTYDFPSASPVADQTTQRIGVHLGGGVLIPFAPKLGLDVSGRYIFMQAEGSDVQLPKEFNPDFWTLGLGLSISF